MTTKKVSKSGVVEFNEEFEDHTETINSDPYGKGWIVKIKPADMAKIENLLNAAKN